MPDGGERFARLVWPSIEPLSLAILNRTLGVGRNASPWGLFASSRSRKEPTDEGRRQLGGNVLWSKTTLFERPGQPLDVLHQ